MRDAIRRPLAGDDDRVHADALTQVCLLGMGGSSLCAEVLRETAPREPDALTLTYDMCLKGRLCSITDHADPPRVIRYDYDEHGLLSMVTDREGHQTRYGYVPLSFGRLDSIEDAIGHVAIKLDYDGQQRVTTEHFALLASILTNPTSMPA